MKEMFAFASIVLEIYDNLQPSRQHMRPQTSLENPGSSIGTVLLEDLFETSWLL